MLDPFEVPVGKLLARPPHVENVAFLHIFAMGDGGEGMRGTGKNANAQEGFQKKETKKEREVRIKQEELEQDEWGGGGYVYNSDDSETQEL